ASRDGCRPRRGGADWRLLVSNLSAICLVLRLDPAVSLFRATVGMDLPDGGVGADVPAVVRAAGLSRFAALAGLRRLLTGGGVDGLAEPSKSGFTPGRRRLRRK